MTIIPFDTSLLLTSFLGNGPAIESAKVRQAKAAFTTPEIQAPWIVEQSSATNLISKLAEARATTNFVTPVTSVGTKTVHDPNLQTSFTVFQALDRLNAIAKAAAKPGISDSDRESLNKSFQIGLGQIEDYLATAGGDKLRFAFTSPTSSTKSLVLPSTGRNASGAGVATNRADPITGVSGHEILSIKLAKRGASDTVNVDLSTIGGPLTLDSIAQAVNSAISSVPLTQSGSPVLDADGNPVAKYLTRITVRKDGGKWGFGWNTPETETVTLQQANAGTALTVSASQDLANAPTAARILTVTDTVGSLAYRNLATIVAVDADATNLAALQPRSKTAQASGDGANAPKGDERVFAKTSAAAVANTADGYSYVVGTTQGDLGSNVGTGKNDLFLTKLDSEGRVVWQRQLGAAGDSQGLAVTVDVQGNPIVAGSTTAHLSASDAFEGQDAFVAKFDSSGDQVFLTQIDGVSATSGAALALDAAGNVYLGGTVSGRLSGQTANGGDDAFVIKLSTTGQLLAKSQFGTAGEDGVSALAVRQDGSLVIGTTENGQAVIHQVDNSSLNELAVPVALGTGQISSIAVDASTGAIAVGGTTLGGLASGTAVNAPSGRTDGFVARLQPDLSVATVTYLGTTGTDSVDSLSFSDGFLYAGGRTNGVLGAARAGLVDGFVARLDAASGAVEAVRQFGGVTATIDRVSIAVNKGGDNILGKLGLQQGAISEVLTDKLTSETTLRVGDSFSIRVGDSPLAKIVIQKDDTLDSLAARINLLTGHRINLTVSRASNGDALSFRAKSGLPVELIAGPSAADALAKLGLQPQRLELPKVIKGSALISPGGTFALGLSNALSLHTAKDAALASSLLDKAIATVQTGYRSLYWDDTKAQLIDGGAAASGPVDAYTAGRLAQYQDALSRISAITGISSFSGF